MIALHCENTVRHVQLMWHIIITLDVTSLLDSHQENWSPDIPYKVKDTFPIYLFTFAENKLMRCSISLSRMICVCVCVIFFLSLYEKWRKVFFFFALRYQRNGVNWIMSWQRTTKKILGRDTTINTHSKDNWVKFSNVVGLMHIFSTAPHCRFRPHFPGTWKRLVTKN